VKDTPMKKRLQVLDGWRGISIICVMMGHLLPLGPKIWQMNASVAASGMVIFFILSGFLITNILISNQNIGNFLVHRFMRIVPLAWLAIIFVLFFDSATSHQWLSSLLFFANWPPMGLVPSLSHFWSLCVEVQFYISIALLIFFLKEKTFWLIPLLCFLVTSFRFYEGVEMAINTYFRVDEILAGCILALIFHNANSNIKRQIARLNTPFLFVLVLVSAHPESGLFNYFRPYFALLLVGSTLFCENKPWEDKLLKSKLLYYIASISYALYVFHGILTHTWLGSGDKMEKYAKRPLLLLLTIILSHLSTKYYESYWIKLGKKITSGSKKNRKQNT
jgi:peptidoglycan/LPS O-acetylase OafA/YrhL